jgi:cell wall-associated NlpC family hydrolase
VYGRVARILAEQGRMGVPTLTVRRAQIAAVLALTVGLAVVSAGASATTPKIHEKEAEAQRVLAEVNSLDIQLGRVNEQLNGAIYELNKVKARERRTAASLAKARKEYRIAVATVAQRLVTLYETPPPSNTDAIFGATNVSAMLDRLELVRAGNALDRRLALNAKLRRAQLDAQERALVVERQQKVAAAATIAAHRHTLGAELAQRQNLLSSIRSEVAHLQAVERARQARLLAEARARLLAEQRARARAAAAAAAARARAARAASTPTTTTATQPATTTSSDGSTTTTSTPPAPTIPTPTIGGHPDAASIALRYIGIPYVFGGSTTDGFDCSGLVMYVYAQLGIQLPHFAAAQYGFGQPVAQGDLQPGDLVFFDALDHVGIYIGNGQFVDAPHTGTFVRIDTFTGWYAAAYVGARRI